jgi:hypothetical protein
MLDGKAQSSAYCFLFYKVYHVEYESFIISSSLISSEGEVDRGAYLPVAAVR